MQNEILTQTLQLQLPRVKQALDFTCGAACFASMYQYFRGSSLGEMHFAKKLGALELGYVPPEHVVQLAKEYGFFCVMKKNAEISDLIVALNNGNVVFVTWWDEDAGHYSLVKQIDGNSIILMDPWKAREGLDNHLTLNEFIPNWEARGGVLILTSESHQGFAQVHR